jgi:integrase/recombinase XerC
MTDPVREFLDYMANQKAASPYTLRNYGHALAEFQKYYAANDPDALDWGKISVGQARDTVIELQRTLDRRTVHNRVAALRSFYRWGVRGGAFKQNPFKAVTLPKLPKKLPIFLSERQVAALLEAPTEREKLGAAPAECRRDRIILELLYGAGLRVSELTALKWVDVLWEQQVLKVLGKGRKERLAPPGSVALEALKAYRADLGNPPDESYIFAHGGSHLTPREVQAQLKLYLKIAGLPADLTPHKLRHTFATHLISNGANLRAIQAMLGHKSLSTTQIYTHLSLDKMREAYTHAHPRA